ncbi:hypothetical protein QN372_02315 [Undibacterium sp. RTI2.1]|nr:MULTISPECIES: hypothetical protein [unclassified Undibacterium]MDY7536761.1 hypothetical protein [Undibacterium sp. 5I1]MEB0029573.1 hypothetical protein [Undibacterium sp. RTI2.1]MEB0115760.1 hypothetical protein [Undibacterium sp. RTI2.2]MEB0232941.1 hypothetical protein [Undibacterium sp. 10I3]MEB0256643.1 hypothetical protein [Undibacterium sp. 5I1]
MSKQEQKEPVASNNVDGVPKFGRLLIVLFLAVALIVFITFATEAYYS